MRSGGCYALTLTLSRGERGRRLHGSSPSPSTSGGVRGLLPLPPGARERELFSLSLRERAGVRAVRSPSLLIFRFPQAASREASGRAE